MKVDRFLRLALGLLIIAVFIIAIGTLLFVTESALSVWDRLVQGPRVILWGYFAVMIALSATAVWLVLRLVVRRKQKPKRDSGPPMNRAEIESRLAEAERTGVDVSQAQAELRALAERQASGSVHLCFFGEISTGKSSLIRALAPDAEVDVSPVGGSTLGIRHYRWTAENGSEILLTDVPGTGGLEEGLDEIAREEAQRAHLVLFVCDGDLTRPEADAVRWLIGLDKPLVLVLNKSDRYDRDEQSLLLERLLDRLGDLGSGLTREQVVAVSAGGETEVVERGPDGSERTTSRRRPADIGVLVVAINRLLGGADAALDLRRDRAVFRLAAEKLAEAEREYRVQRAEQIIRSSTRKAVVGALAAVSPGTDIVIQGYIGTSMTRELCRLYGTQPRDLDIEQFLDLSQSRAGRAVPLTLAVAGNGLKAFPGAGTVAGGLVHAVAYGLIFDALGRSLVMTLEKHGELEPGKAAREFEEGLSENIEAGVRQVARMALDWEKDKR